MRKIYLLFFVLSQLISFDQLFAQREVIVKRTLRVNCTNSDYSLQSCAFGLMVPADRPGRQEIIEYTYPSLKPSNVTKTGANEYYLKWLNYSFGQLNKNDLQVNIKLKLTVYDLKAARKKPLIDKADLDTIPYLKDEENFRINAKNIKEASAQITGLNREDITRSIFNYVVKALDYHIYLNQDRGAKQALKDGKGDCTEYSELMITLCRAKKIPARIVAGLIPGSSGTVGYHNWVEVFFPQYGWVSFDPTWADSPSATTSFSTMKNTYIELSHRRYVNQWLCPCWGTFPFSLAFKDTCMDLTNNIGKLFKDAFKNYQSYQNEKAAFLLDSLLKIEPDNNEFLMLRGVTHARLNEFEKGWGLIQTAIANAETSAQKTKALYSLANYYALKGEGDNTIKALKDAIESGFTQFSHLYIDSDFHKLNNYEPYINFIKELQRGQKSRKDD